MLKKITKKSPSAVFATFDACYISFFDVCLSPRECFGLAANDSTDGLSLVARSMLREPATQFKTPINLIRTVTDCGRDKGAGVERVFDMTTRLPTSTGDADIASETCEYLLRVYGREGKCDLGAKRALVALGKRGQLLSGIERPPICLHSAYVHKQATHICGVCMHIHAHASAFGMHDMFHD